VPGIVAFVSGGVGEAVGSLDPDCFLEAAGVSTVDSPEAFERCTEGVIV
jgi:hypothetical protein